MKDRDKNRCQRRDTGRDRIKHTVPYSYQWLIASYAGAGLVPHLRLSSFYKSSLVQTCSSHRVVPGNTCATLL